MAEQSEASVDTRTLVILAFATTAGVLVEFYDFLIYGFAAASAFPSIFFPGLAPTSSRERNEEEGIRDRCRLDSGCITGRPSMIRLREKLRTIHEELYLRLSALPYDRDARDFRTPSITFIRSATSWMASSVSSTRMRFACASSMFASCRSSICRPFLVIRQST